MTYAFKHDEVLFLIKTIVALSALYFIWINQLFCVEIYFQAAPNFRKYLLMYIAMRNKSQSF